MSKVTPIYYSLNSALIQYGLFNTFLSVDESIVSILIATVVKCLFVASQFVSDIKFGVSAEKTDTIPFKHLHLVILISTVTGWVSISAFASLSFAIELKICTITAGIKKYKSIINNKKHDKLLLAKSKLSRKEVSIYMALINSNISHDKFVLINDVLKEFYYMKEEIKNSNDK